MRRPAGSSLRSAAIAAGTEGVRKWRPLVTLQQAKDHLQVPTMPGGDPDEADLQLKLDQAEAIILDYLAAKADPAWTARRRCRAR